MPDVSIDFRQKSGRIAPLHAVNNGPVYKFTLDQRITNLPAFQEAGIPFARTHDASFYSTYGGEHTVDVHAIFPDFSKDENDPSSYDFCLTDEYLKVMDFAGVEPFYRLGSKIEHWPKKYGTLPPPDFHKWARVCEHIIRHYTEGWADGFRYRIRYWEIWNEPDGAKDDADPVDKKCWGGTQKQFHEFFDIVARHLKHCFPHLKIGGPAMCCPRGCWDYALPFLEYLAAHGTPLDFYSWHLYASEPQKYVAAMREARALLDRYGFRNTESILNEWNYVKGWTNDDWLYSLRTEKNLKGSSFTAAVMASAMYESLDMLMYYDARPCGMNGLFSTDFVCDKLKGYYPFLMMGTLYRLGTAVPVKTDDDTLYACAATDDVSRAVMITHFEDTDASADASVRLTLSGLSGAPTRATIKYLDAARDCEVVREEVLTGTSASLYLTLPLFTTALVTLTPEKA